MTFKTVSCIGEGFNFLGFNIRKYKGKLLIKPCKKSIERFLDEIREIVHTKIAIKSDEVIRILNPKIGGWANHFRHVVAKETFSKVDSVIFKKLWWWIKRRHPTKSAAWRRKRYFRSEGLKNWVFYGISILRDGKLKLRDLKKADAIPIVRHIKIRASANPYDPDYIDYFAQRKAQRTMRIATGVEL